MSVGRFGPSGRVLDGLRRDTFSTAVRSAVTARLSDRHFPIFIAPQSSRTSLSCSVVLVPTLITHKYLQDSSLRSVYSCIFERPSGLKVTWSKTIGFPLRHKRIVTDTELSKTFYAIFHPSRDFILTYSKHTRIYITYIVNRTVQRYKFCTFFLYNLFSSKMVVNIMQYTEW
jgi:hypothetical protein